MEVSLAHWRKSSYSRVNNYCVECSVSPGVTALRDSKHPDAAMLAFSSTEWSAFIRSACSGEL
ncbi:DUF397 domain-containing protein [Nocardiopsis sediminis]|uniref:DUF397 domain-containing protein n=1 Tax=Nocardiopsis sediminis TaxID=1778267 RepID=A0ABV8FKN7_9ACTN